MLDVYDEIMRRYGGGEPEKDGEEDVDESALCSLDMEGWTVLTDDDGLYIERGGQRLGPYDSYRECLIGARHDT